MVFSRTDALFSTGLEIATLTSPHSVEVLWGWGGVWGGSMLGVCVWVKILAGGVLHLRLSAV